MVIDAGTSLWLMLFFGLTVVVALCLLAAATRSKPLVFASLAWIALQSAAALTGFYTQTAHLPPRFLLAIAPPVLAACVPFLFAPGRRFADSTSLPWLILFQTVRVLVELNLFWLFRAKQVPALLTFEGGNLDILVGLTAPLIWWAWRHQRLSDKALLAWNGVALLSLLNAVVRAVLSAPFPFQRFGFHQPTVAILYFPFILLPACVVPAALFCHLALFRKLRTASFLPA